MSSIFTKIIRREIPAYIVAEDSNHIAFLDINPNSFGHTLCVTKKEVDKIFDLSRNEYINLMNFSRKVALALKKTISCNRIGISVIGLEVPHVHVHLIPLNSMLDATFQRKINLTKTEMSELSKKISSNFNL